VFNLLQNKLTCFTLHVHVLITHGLTNCIEDSMIDIYTFPWRLYIQNIRTWHVK